MKKAFYIFCFGFLGLLVATLIHAGAELLALHIIFSNPAEFAGTFWWNEWFLVHDMASNFLWLLGLVGGVYGGFKYWDILYVKGGRTS